MNKFRVIFLLAMVSSMVRPCEANEAVQSAAKAALEKMSGGNLGKLYKVRSQAETAKRREMVIKACVAGLYAIGDAKNAMKVSENLSGDDYVSSFMSECGRCDGAGSLPRNCYKCKGGGKCQNSKCKDGTVTAPGFDGRSSSRKCSVCGGTGKCADCKGVGSTSSVCTSCNGAKRIVKKEQALASCQELLRALMVSGKEIKPDEEPKTETRLSGKKKDCKRTSTEDNKSQRKEVESSEVAEIIKRGCATNKSKAHKDFQEYEFDFADYQLWSDKRTTKLQKDKIIERLFSGGFESHLYKDWCRCYFALVPDGLAFVVRDVNESVYSNGKKLYKVSLKFQNEAIGSDLREQRLFPGYHPQLVIEDDDMAAKLNKGDVLVSKGWVYDVYVVDAIVSSMDQLGRISKRVDRYIAGGGRRSCSNLYRSMDERNKIEIEAVENRGFQMLNNDNQESGSSFGSRSSSYMPTQNRSSGIRSEDLFSMWKCRYCGNVVSSSMPPSNSTCLQHRENGGFGPCVFDKVH